MIRGFVRGHLTQVAGTLGCLVGGSVFALLLMDFRTDWTRRAVELGFASNFFDLQARAFLAGRLWVPDGSLGIEGFLVRGHTYMYFPPFPALARLPIFLVTDRYDGRLTVVMMAVAFVLYAVLVTKLLWLVRSCLTSAPVSARDAVAGALFLTLATGGTVLTFDASLPWVYHEVYLWAVALVVGSLYFLLRTALEPTRANTWWLGAFTLATALTRTTGGFAVAAVVLVVGAWIAFGRTSPGDRRQGLFVVLAGVVPLAASISYNWVKFRHPYLFPLQDQVWTGVNAHRREALAANGGTITGPQFLPTTVSAYFDPFGIRFTPWFPWISLPAHPPAAVGGVVVDQSYRTGSVIAFNPLLVGLTVAALVAVVRRRRSAVGKTLGAVLVAAAGVGGGVLMYGYLTMRYTSEFVPVLVVGGAIGLWALLPRLIPRRRSAVLTMAVLSLLVTWSVLAHLATGYTASVTSARGERLRDYVSEQLANAGDNPAGLPPVLAVTDQPSGGSTDSLGIEGDCEALYLNTGDTYDPWILVERRPVAITVDAGPEVRPGTVPLFDITADEKRQVVMEIDHEHNALIFVRGPSGDALGAYLPVHPGQSVRVGVGIDTGRGLARVSASPGGPVANVPWAHWDSDWVAAQGKVAPSPASASKAQELGLTIRPAQTPSLNLCQRVAALKAP